VRFVSVYIFYFIVTNEIIICDTVTICFSLDKYYTDIGSSLYAECKYIEPIRILSL